MRKNLTEDLNSGVISMSQGYHYWSQLHGLTDYLTNILYELLTHDQMTLTDITKRSNLPKQTLSKGIHQLLDQGYLVQVDDPTDSRIKWCKLTESGKKYAKRQVGPLFALEEELIAELGADKVILMNDLIQQWNEKFWEKLKAERMKA